MSELLQKVPFIRVLCPLVIGILIADKWRMNYEIWTTDRLVCMSGLLLLGLFVLIVVLFNNKRGNGLLSVRVYGLLIALFLSVWGFFRFFADCRSDLTGCYGKERVYTILITGTPEKKPRSILCEGLLLAEDGMLSDKTRRLLLYFQRDSIAETLKLGDGITCYSSISRPQNKGNPEEFDYAGYLFRQGIHGQVFIWGDPWTKLSKFELDRYALPWTEKLKLKALSWRERLIDQYRQSGLGGEELSLYSALTLGDQSEMPSSLKKMYSAAGVSHILALSGMHLCYLVALFNFFLFKFEYRRWISLIVSLGAFGLVWGYCLMVGFPSSLVRASIMYSLMLLGRMVGRKGFSVNSLAASAFVMLSVNPNWLFDIGFLLSCLAMCGILVGMPRFVAAVKVKNRYVRLVVDSLAMSFCAQLLTVPLVAYVFHSVSLYSAFVTLVLTPITAVLIYMMPLLWTVNVILPWGAAWLAGILTLLIKLQHQILQLVVELPGAVLTCYPDIRVVILVYLLLLIWMCRPFLSFVWWVRSNVFIVVLLTEALYYSYWQKERLQPSLVFYNNTSCPAAHLVRTRDRSYLIPVHVDSVSAHMRYIAESYWDKCLKSYPHLVGTGYDDGYVRCYQGIVFSPDVSFVVLSDDRWNACVPGSPLRIDYLYVCRGFYGKLSSLQTVFRPGTVVLDASLSKRQNERLADECRRLKWTFYDMRLSGALKVPLK